MNHLLFIDISISEPLTQEEKQELKEQIDYMLGMDKYAIKDFFPKVKSYYIGECEL